MQFAKVKLKSYCRKSILKNIKNRVLFGLNIIILIFYVIDKPLHKEYIW